MPVSIPCLVDIRKRVPNLSSGASIPTNTLEQVPPPLPSPPLPSPPLPSPPLRSRPPLLRLGGLGERFSSPSLVVYKLRPPSLSKSSFASSNSSVGTQKGFFRPCYGRTDGRTNGQTDRQTDDIRWQYRYADKRRGARKQTLMPMSMVLLVVLRRLRSHRRISL